ncbi:hypothetical protein FPHOBKDP_00227 [Listeria phage LPJP1]|nr:hypothetical protein FPHOBKDP_00227 [Listeria phage LPJP1]
MDYGNYFGYDTENIEKIMNSKKVKYTKLMSMVKNYVTRESIGKNVNIYIDMNTILKQIYNKDNIEIFNHLKSDKRLFITAEIINIIGHYRHFFSSRLKMYTTFYLFTSFEKSSYHTNIYPDYRKEYYEKRLGDRDFVFSNINKIIKDNMNIVKKILKYVPNAYLINTKDNDPSLVPTYLLNDNRFTLDTDLNIIISNDKLFRQDLLYRDNTLILEIKGKDNKRLIAYEDVINTIVDSTKGKRVYSDYNLLTESITLLDPLVKNKEYNINSIKRTSEMKALDIIEKGINDNIISSQSYYDVDEAYNDLAFYLGENNEDEFKRNMSIVNHKIAMSHTFKDLEHVILSQIIDLEDDRGLMELNDKFFSKYPIVMDYLGESFYDPR